MQPRLRMFAGPNGSGKSTIKSVLKPEQLGVYINPDEIEAAIRKTGELDLSAFGLAITGDEIRQYLESSPLLKASGDTSLARDIRCDGGKLRLGGMSGTGASPYTAAVIADFIRKKLLAARISFTFETVMSSPDKIELLKAARAAGYRTYLYYIATDDPEINVSRVRNRVADGGHSVPEDKIRSRYARSLGLLMDAIRHTHRAYVFDNSEDGRQRTWVAEVTDGALIENKVDPIPAWFKHAVWDKAIPVPRG